MRLADLMDQQHGYLDRAVPALDVDAKKVLHLRETDEDRRAGREAADDGVGHEVDEEPHLQESQRDLDHANRQGEHGRVANVLGRAGPRERGATREDEDGHDRRRADRQVSRRTDQRVGQQGEDGSVEPVDGWQAGQHCVGHRLRYQENCDGHAGYQIAAQVRSVVCAHPLNAGEDPLKQVLMPSSQVLYAFRGGFGHSCRALLSRHGEDGARLGRNAVRYHA